jgi:hypothetical protein
MSGGINGYWHPDLQKQIKDILDAIARNEDPDYLEPPDHRGGGSFEDRARHFDDEVRNAQVRAGMGTPGLPRYASERPTHFPMCVYCFLGVCDHADHAEGEQRHVWALSMWEGCPACGQCIQSRHNKARDKVRRREQ